MHTQQHAVELELKPGVFVMKIKYLLAASVVSLSAAATFATPASAQNITSGVEGTVTDAAGAPVAGASVTVTDTRTNTARTLSTDGDGQFRTSSLAPGGPYTVTATATGFEGQTVENQFINISGNTDFTFELASTAAGGSDNTIVVTGSRARVTQLAVGPGVAFGSAELEAFPSITRDVRDIIRLDPRVSLERSNEVDRISCLGGNDRSNTFTVDGIVQADVFGLNGTPFAARNSLPLPFDVIEQTSVEFAPFDVEYSDFTGCLVNVVTKAGTNEFSGSAFVTYFDEGLQADEVGGVPQNAGRETRWGATLSGPIIPDRLFFSLGYEETDLGDGNNVGPVGSGFGTELDYVDQAQFDRFAQIANDVYGQDIGGLPTQLAESAVRYFGRLDANITDDQRLEATYQRLEETNIESDFGGDEFGGVNSFEDEGTISDYYSLRLYSQWSDNVSTELRISRAEVGDVQGPLGFGEAQSDNPTTRLTVGVSQPGPDGILGTADDENGRLSTGPGIFRSANQLDTRIDQARLQMNIEAGGGHSIKLGAEINDLQVFNLFAINATGTIFFQNLDDFENGLVAAGGFSSVFADGDDLADGGLGGATINATPSGDINQAAASFGRQIYSFYAQDEWRATDQLTVNAGVRVQMYAGDAPTANPAFAERFGFTNANSFGRLDPVLLPRLSATYDFDNDGFLSNSRLTGGVGIFSGGDPVVFYSNAFSNNGFSTGEGNTFDCDPADLNIDPATGQIQVTAAVVPQCAIAAASAQAAAGGADTQSTSPDISSPTVIRANLGFATEIGTETGFFSGWRMNLDYIYSRFKNPLNFVDLVQTPNITQGLNGFTVDGRPILAAIDNSFPDCNATLQNNGGTPPTYSGVTADCFVNNVTGGTPRVDDFIQLTNGPSSDSHTASFLLSKNFDGGVFTENGGTSLRLGYAFTDSSNARNNGSSTATSSFDVTAAFDRQDPAVSTSNFETRHNFTAAVSFREEFFGDYNTNLGIFFRARSGRPYSLTFDGGGVFADGSSGNDNALLYIPTGVSDANVSPLSDPAAVTSLIDYVNNVNTDCSFTAGETIDRNTCRNDWHIDLDMRISQELPFLGSLTGIKEDRIELFADFDNFLNLIDGGSNILRSRGGFAGLVDVVDGGVDDQGRYIITGFNPDDDNDIAFSASTWRIQVGVRYEF